MRFTVALPILCLFSHSVQATIRIPVDSNTQLEQELPLNTVDNRRGKFSTNPWAHWTSAPFQSEDPNAEIAAAHDIQKRFGLDPLNLMNAATLTSRNYMYWMYSPEEKYSGRNPHTLSLNELATCMIKIQPDNVGTRGVLGALYRRRRDVHGQAVPLSGADLETLLTGRPGKQGFNFRSVLRVKGPTPEERVQQVYEGMYAAQSPVIPKSIAKRCKVTNYLARGPQSPVDPNSLAKQLRGRRRTSRVAPETSQVVETTGSA